MNLLERVQDYLAHEQLLRPESRAVVAVSGGPDSLCLLHVLQRLSAYRLHVAHLDHGLRSDSAAEAHFVRETAQAWGLPVTVGQADLGGPDRQGPGLEQEARDARYRFLVRVAEDWGAEAIVTGHTASDQVETIVMHFLRGAGVHGLRGMRPRVDLSTWGFLQLERPIHLVRPLLECTRDETRAYCQRHDLSPRQDPSNLDRTYLRNRIRLDLIPVLEEYQPALHSILPRTGRVMRATADLLDELAQEALEDCARTAGKQSWALVRDRYTGLPLIVRWEVIRRLVRALGPEVDELDFETVERAQTAIQAGLEGRHSLAADLELESAGAEVVIRRQGARVRFPQVPQIEDEGDVQLPAEIDLADGWRLTLSIQALAEDERFAITRGAGGWSDPYRDALDADGLARRLTLRSPREGDRFQPLGMEGSMPLADFFINEGIPRLQRKRWPLLTSEGVVVWVAGLRLADSVRVTENSDEIVHLKLHKP